MIGWMGDYMNVWMDEWEDGWENGRLIALMDEWLIGLVVG